MNFTVQTARARRGFWAAGFALLALHGCSASGVDSGTGDGGATDAGTGGSSSSGSGGVSGSGGNSGSSSGGAQGSGGVSGSGGKIGGSGGASAGSGGSSGTSTGGSSGGGTPHCTTSIEPVYPSTQTVEAAADATVQLRVVVNQSPYMMLGWTWEVTGPGGKTVKVSISGDAPNHDTMAEFGVTIPDTYQVKATPSGDPRCPEAYLPIYGTAPQGPSFNIRAAASGYPTQDRKVKLSSLPDTLEVSPGQSFTVKPLNPLNGALLDTYVRISSANQVFTFEGNTTVKPLTTSLLATESYNLLIAPMESPSSGGTAAGGTFAPFLQSSTPSNWSPQGFFVDQGVQVSGQALTAGGMPIQNALMQLRSMTGTPSTVGTSDASGALTMWARDGSMSALIVPPDGSGLPIASSAAGAIDSVTGAPVTLTMQWAAMAKSTLTAQIRGADGVSPVPNAQVLLASSGMSYSAGTLTVQSPGADDVVLPTTASVTDSALTADDGHVTFPPYPPGIYSLTIIPTAAAAPAAVTTVQITLTAGAVSQTIALAGKVSLTGTVTTPSGRPAAGAQVTAIDAGNACTTTTKECAPAAGTSAATGSVFTGQADANGLFALSVDPDRTYELVVQPSAADSATLGRAVKPAVHLCSTAAAPCTAINNSVGTIVLPAGTQYQATLSGSDGARVGGASIQVFCTLASPTCDPSVSLAETTSLGNGAFTVVLPVPAPTSSALSK